MRVELRDRRRVRAERDLRPAHRAAQVRDVEQRQLRAEPAALLGGVLADAEQQVLRHGVQVGRVAEDLQLAQHLRVALVGQVERVQRVDLAERHDVTVVADEAHRVDPLALAQSADAAELRQRAAADLEHADVALAVARDRALKPLRLVGGGDPQRALVLGQRVLVEHEAGHLARAGI